MQFSAKSNQCKEQEENTMYFIQLSSYTFSRHLSLFNANINVGPGFFIDVFQSIGIEYNGYDE